MSDIVSVNKYFNMSHVFCIIEKKEGLRGKLFVSRLHEVVIIVVMHHQ